MENLFRRLISGSQSKYFAKFQLKTDNSRHQQCSYNLDIDLGRKLLDIGAIQQEGSDNQGRNVRYCLANGYKAKLGENLKALINYDENLSEVGVVFTQTCDSNGGSKKFQLKKVDFANKRDNRYNWFVKLYENNIENINFDTYIDIEHKIIIFDLSLTPEFLNQIRTINSTEQFVTTDFATGGLNIIYYGVPGSGKSWLIKKEFGNDPETTETVVFHPDYTYSEFIGQILPKIDENGAVNYVFSPGAFTRILKKAFDNPNLKFNLIIEEINRGNAPAIFGDIFQLLDRNEEGESTYKITNPDIANIVFNGDTNQKIFIPSNLSIIASMNTSDQNSFTLDTAFQRRWNMRCVQNVFNASEYDNELSSTNILDTNVSWKKFWTVINKNIDELSLSMATSGDKALGTHFVNKQDLTSDNFAEKVIKYLWDDAFKYDRSKIFNTQVFPKLEKVISHFASNSGIRKFDIFNKNVVDSLTINE